MPLLSSSPSKHIIYRRLIKETVLAQSSHSDDISYTSLKPVFSKEGFCQTVHLRYQFLFHPRESRQGNLGQDAPDPLAGRAALATRDTPHRQHYPIFSWLMAPVKHEPKLNSKLHLENDINPQSQSQLMGPWILVWLLTKKSILPAPPGSHFKAG